MARTGNNSRIPALGVYGGAPTFAADLTDITNTIAPLIGESVANVAALPASGNWAGRTITVGDPATAIYVWSTAGWVRTWSVGSPYAQAVGTFALPALAAGGTALVTVSLPASRFTVPPLVSLSSGGLRVTAHADTVTTTSCAIALFNLSSGASGADTGNWHAYQMTPTTAAG